jgi:hypothetical protein
MGQKERGVMVAAAISVLVDDLRADTKPNKSQREKRLEGVLDKLATHGLAMLVQMACDAESAARSLEKLARMQHMQLEMTLDAIAGKGSLGQDAGGSYRHRLDEIMNAEDHTGTAGHRKDDEDGGPRGGGAGPRNPA